jgi:hypothetical protein
MDKSLIAIIVFLILCLAASGEETNAVKKIEKELKKYYYVKTDTVIVGQPNEKKIEQAVDLNHVETTKQGNCLELAVIAKDLAKAEGLKTKYLIENNHVALKVTTKNGASYRFSNGKNTGRCW